MPEPKQLKRWLEESAERGKALGRAAAAKIKARRPTGGGGRRKKLSELTSEDFSRYDRWLRVGVIVLLVFVLSEIVSQIIRVFIPPTVPQIPQARFTKPALRPRPAEEFDVILSRNVFNVEGTIPDPLDQGRMDCMSQAKPSSQRISLLGTIVMNDENFSTALVEEPGNPVKLAVKKDDVFFDAKFQVMKVDRKRLCFQVKATQDFEYIEIPDEGARLGSSGLSLSGGSEGITPVSENDYNVKRDFLEKQILNLTDILQTARAIPYIDQNTGKFRGFLVQSMDPNSPFRQLGVNQGDVLTGVNDIVLDNAGKAIEAFQILRNAPKISLKVLRGGQEQTVNFNITN